MAAAAVGPAGQRAGEFVDWIDFRPVASEISSEINSATRLLWDVAAIAAHYITGEKRIGVFGPNFWQSGRIDAGAVRPIDPAFYEYWYGPDPVDPTRRVCDTHHWPVWIPEGLSLATLQTAGLRFYPNNDTEALLQHRNTPTGGGYYAVMRKEVLGRYLPEVEQIQQLNRAGYLVLAQAADVAAVIFAINQHDGSRWLGDTTGAENCWTYTRCVEKVAFGKRRYPLVIGGSSPSGVHVHHFGYEAERVGVAALRKF